MKGISTRGPGVTAALGLSLFALVVVSSASAKTVKLTVPKKVTVVAIAKNGAKTTSVQKSGSLTLKAPAKSFTLNFVDSSGSYIGPLVVGKSGKKKVLEAVKAGAKLGAVRINTKKGVVTPKRKLAAKFVDRSFLAKAKNGVPIGANRRIGLVKTKSKGSSTKVGADSDGDGIVNAFDVDVNGNGILNNLDSSSGKQAHSASVVGAAADEQPPPPPGGQPGPPPPGSPPGGGPGQAPGSDTFRVFSNLKADMVQSLNANASAVTLAQINSFVSSTQTLAIQVPHADSVKLDCTGLSYCSLGGTGKSAGSGDPAGATPFPDPATTGSDGFGVLQAGSTGDFQLLTGANSDQIGSGDSFVEILTNGGAQTQLPGTLNFAFVTTPALINWSTGSGSGTVSYPVSQAAVGTAGNPIPVPSGSATATLTFWRPQRQAIPNTGEGSGYIDIGKLFYTADVPSAPGAQGAPSSARGPGNCAASSYSTSDPNIDLTANGPQDKANDAPANPGSTLTFTVNLTACLASSGSSWSSGQDLRVDIQARSENGDNSAQGLFFRMQ